MPRLKFDLQPVLAGWRDDKDEHEAWVREVYARHHPDEEPRACDCGYYIPDRLVTCTERDRAACRANVQRRLEHHYRDKHQRGLRAKREWPGLPFPKVGYGTCHWCGQPITLGRVKQRMFHDGRADEPDCKGRRDLHIDLGAQQLHLVARDGLGCRGCGKVAGRWSRFALSAATLARWAAERPERYPPTVWVGEATVCGWSTALEVDHFVALAVAWEAFQADERRRWFFSPGNLQLLCGECHLAKTRADVALIKMAQARGPEWAKAEVLRRLADAGLLRGPKPGETA